MGSYLLFLLLLHAGFCIVDNEEKRAKDFLEDLNKKYEASENKIALADWGYESNLTDSNLEKKLVLQREIAKERKRLWNEIIKYNWKKFSDYDLKRQFKKYSKLDKYVLSEEKLTKFNKIISHMEKIYSTAKICAYNNPQKCDLSLEPELTKILETSRNPHELKHVWVQWRNSVGRKCKDLYKEYVDLSNEVANLNNYTNNAEMWLDTNYEDIGLKDQVTGLWNQLRPLYLQIHGYVRYQLRKKYGNIVSEKGPIPAHLLGNMWSQQWSNIAEFTLPFPDKKPENLTEELINQNYTVVKIFKTAEDFFKSINLTEMPQSFWEKSILLKPRDREIVCHASAWDFNDRKDFRIKQCTEITIKHFEIAHHEMGHIEYFLQYKDLPIRYREGANSGFHEAVGDLISLSVGSTKHLRKLGLLKTKSDDPDNLLNNLFTIGLDKIVFLPFALVMDFWRWDVFAGKIKPEKYNCEWWKLRELYQGIEAPVERTDEDFDPAAKYHIISDVPYIRYFVSFVLQFQFHKAMCEIAGQYNPSDPSKPLHECDIYQNTKAGNALKKMLQMGSSRPWPDALEILTGQRRMDASALLEYFEPLRNWLEKENKKQGVHIGWESSKIGTLYFP